ncbi:MAG: cell division protein FtsZ [Limisphaerales bacterium]
MSEPIEDSTAPILAKPGLSIKFFGVGGAGGNAVSCLAGAGFPGVTFAAMNTDAQALANVTVDQKLTLGGKLTRGLGTGGEPELGWAAAEQEAGQLKSLCAGADVVFLALGLGGGTGTGAAPVVARVAKEAGALVLAFAFLPFECEGSRRYRQAQEGLQQLKAVADGVICLPNQRVFKMIDENTSLVETFKITNDLLARGVRGIWRLLTQHGLVNVDFADLRTVLRGRHAESSLATAEAAGPGRAREVVAKLFANPMLEGGQVLGDADAVLVSLVSGSDFTMAEVNRVMEPINRLCENAHLIMGATIDPAFQDRLEVTLVASIRGKPEEKSPPAPATEAAGSDDTENAGAALDFDALGRDVPPGPRPRSRFIGPAPALTPERAEQLLKQQTGSLRSRKSSSRWRQGQLQLEIIPKDRFAKSEPTIHRGEDLDVPTYIRRGVALN